jgi:murein DD-endopeptidase MepM/ murein hydrolase activator NlpD
MKYALLFLQCLFLNAQEQSPAEKKIVQYIKICQNTTDLKKIEIFKEKFPAIFKFYPDINPINPKNKPGISSNFSKKRLHPIENEVQKHNGLDITARNNTPVYSSADGIVKKSQFYNGKAGHSVEIIHNYGFKTKYFHLSIFIVKNGEHVRKGQIIGFLGTSGASTGPHLHYEIIKNNIHLNPLIFLSK